jgi:hypothetical protein
MYIKVQGGMYQNPKHVIDLHINLLVIHQGLALLLITSYMDLDQRLLHYMLLVVLL